MKTESKVKGFINETHKSEVESVFGREVAEKLENAEAGQTFLSILFDLNN